MHVFGCDVYCYNHKVHRENKLDTTSNKGIFVGYDKYNDTYYRIYDPDENKIIISRDVKFYDNNFTISKQLKHKFKNDNDIDDKNDLSKEELVYIDASLDDTLDDTYTDNQIEEMFKDTNNNSNKDVIEITSEKHEIQSDNNNNIKNNIISNNINNI